MNTEPDRISITFWSFSILWISSISAPAACEMEGNV